MHLLKHAAARVMGSHRYVGGWSLRPTGHGTAELVLETPRFLVCFLPHELATFRSHVVGCVRVWCGRVVTGVVPQHGTLPELGD